MAGLAARAPIVQAAIGTMLSGPGLPYLPAENESNTMIHLVGESGSGKTTIVRAGASVHGKGSQTTDPESYLEVVQKHGQRHRKTSLWPIII